MNFLKITSRFQSNVRRISQKTIVEELRNRELIRVRGKESTEFLQGLITNDIKHLNKEAYSMYAMFLNDAGRVLYDSIIYRAREPNNYIIECDKAIANDLRRHLRIFRVRKKIDIESIANEFTSWVIYSDNCEGDSVNLPIVTTENVLITPDPRTRKLGSRIIVPKQYKFDEISELFSNEQKIFPSNDLDNYETHRHRLGVGEGIVDHPPTKCFPLESNCDYLHGVSFHKGCYLGQELTARVYHTGVIRKRLVPIELPSEISADVKKIQLHSGSDVGSIRSMKNKYALALVRIDKVSKVPYILVDGKEAIINIPDWWPKEAPNAKIDDLKKMDA